MEEREARFRAVAQRGDTQELHARRTSARTKDISKLGDQGLIETLAAPSQGAHPPLSLRLTTGATLGPYEFEDQAWMEGNEHISEGMEDVHEETDGERQTWLMVLEGGAWMCKECPGEMFFNRSMLQRHCNSVHRKYDK